VTRTARKSGIQYRFGIGEWYGTPLTSLTSQQRRHFASIQALPKEERPAQACPFLSDEHNSVNCHKPGGICSLRLYERAAETGEVRVASVRNTLRTTCPSRFEQSKTIYGWIGQTILGNSAAIPIGQTPFLEPVETMGNVDPGTKREVGRIDNILAVPNSEPLQWCPVELQAVYFSGEKMGLDFAFIANSDSETLPWPLKNRRPDYRSSGPKRLLPQLSTKVPTLSGWAKRMAVVVDEDFFWPTGKNESRQRYVELRSCLVCRSLPRRAARIRARGKSGTIHDEAKGSRIGTCGCNTGAASKVRGEHQNKAGEGSGRFLTHDKFLPISISHMISWWVFFIGTKAVWKPNSIAKLLISGALS